MDHSLPGSPVHEILQAKLQEWVAIPSSRGSSPPRDQTTSPASAARFFVTESAGKPAILKLGQFITLLWPLSVQVKEESQVSQFKSKARNRLNEGGM